MLSPLTQTFLQVMPFKAEKKMESTSYKPLSVYGTNRTTPVFGVDSCKLWDVTCGLKKEKQVVYDYYNVTRPLVPTFLSFQPKIIQYLADFKLMAII